MRRFASKVVAPGSGFISTSLSKMASSSCGGSSSAKLHGIVNDLQFQKSPYLLQHKHNPVEWHPWSAATHELAVKRGLPIFLSIGYSTCHWCHVMERESFENPAIAAIMNEHFINVKVDREEHPDIDRIYMSFVQAISGSGGWPLSVWLTPKLHPFYGGTYYPPDNRYFGRPGFKSLLLSIAEQWEESREKCEESAANIVKLLEKSAGAVVGAGVPDGGAVSDKCVSQLKRSYEPSFGGFSEAPKFPQPGNLLFLIDYCGKGKLGSNGASSDVVGSVQKMVERTLLMMAQGGIWDHVGKGFARYSTDKKWHVPHFEKMLYDQAQLVEAYAGTYKLNGDEFYATVCSDIIEYVGRDLTHALGGFYSAEDADSENVDGVKREGAFYAWKQSEIESVLGDGREADMVCFRFGVKEKGNVDPYQDPHDELKDQNVLFLAQSFDKVAEKFGVGVGEASEVVGRGVNKLFEWRGANRKRPGLDDKIIGSWNGLMITGLCNASLCLGNDAYYDMAAAAMRFCKQHLVTADFDLLRSCYTTPDKTGVTNLSEPIHGCVDDFANLVSGCLGLFQASGGDKEWVELAKKLQEKQDELFWDGEKGGYFSSRVEPSVIVRMKDDDDGAEPSSNSTSLRNLMQLSQIALVQGVPDVYAEKVPKLIKQFGDRLEKIPISLPVMSALVQSHTGKLVTTLVFDGNDAELRRGVGKRVLLPSGSVLFGVKDPSSVSTEFYSPGKIVKVRGGEKVVIESVDSL